MTSISTVAGMVPIALELGAGGEVRSPMAIAVIGGFSTATLLTLIIVPVCFTYIAHLQQHLSTFPSWSARLIVQFLRWLFGQRASLVSAATSHTYPTPKFVNTASSHTTAPFPSSQVEQFPKQQHQSSLAPRPGMSTQSASALSTSTLSKTADFPTSFQAALGENPGKLQEPVALEPTYTIACIENDLATLCSLHDYLDDTIFTVVSANDPAVALTELTLYDPNIILITLSMPGINGFRVCDRLRKSHSFRHVPILLLSSNPSWWQSLKAKWHGATACLPKPLDRTQLLIQLFLLMV